MCFYNTEYESAPISIIYELFYFEIESMTKAALVKDNI